MKLAPCVALVTFSNSHIAAQGTIFQMNAARRNFQPSDLVLDKLRHLRKNVCSFYLVKARIIILNTLNCFCSERNKYLQIMFCFLRTTWN